MNIEEGKFYKAVDMVVVNGKPMRTPGGFSRVIETIDGKAVSFTVHEWPVLPPEPRLCRVFILSRSDFERMYLPL